MTGLVSKDIGSMTRLLFLPLVLFIIAFSETSYAANKILVLGDSLSAAYKIDINKGWVKLLENKIKSEGYNYEVVNSSISGDTTQNGLNRIKADMDKYIPSIMILALGSNDGLRGKKPSSIKKNLISIINIAKEYGCRVLLIGFRMPGNYGAFYTYKFAELFEDLASELNLSFVPFLLDGFALDEKNYFLKDKLHPNEKAQPLILNNVWPHLKPMLRKY